jgi:hypothetical protein
MNANIITMGPMTCTCGNHSPGRAASAAKPEPGEGKFGVIIVESPDRTLHVGMDCRQCMAIFTLYGDPEVLQKYNEARREQVTIKSWPKNSPL